MLFLGLAVSPSLIRCLREVKLLQSFMVAEKQHMKLDVVNCQITCKGFKQHSGGEFHAICGVQSLTGSENALNLLNT